MCCSCFMNTKYECLKCKIPICNQCSVFEENEEVDGWKAGSSVAYCEPCDIEVRRAQGITPEEQSIDSFRSKKKKVKIFYDDIISIFIGIWLFLAFDTMCIINTHARAQIDICTGEFSVYVFDIIFAYLRKQGKLL